MMMVLKPSLEIQQQAKKVPFFLVFFCVYQIKKKTGEKQIDGTGIHHHQ